jgi:hypothetical protein
MVLSWGSGLQEVDEDGCMRIDPLWEAGSGREDVVAVVMGGTLGQQGRWTCSGAQRHWLHAHLVVGREVEKTITPKVGGRQWDGLGRNNLVNRCSASKMRMGAWSVTICAQRTKR